MTEITPAQREFIDSNWRNRWDFMIQCQNQIINFIFAIHGGGIAGLLAFAASKESTFSVKLGIGFFSLGLVLIVVYAVLMFYYESNSFRRYQKRVAQLFSGSAQWNDLVAAGAKEKDRYISCEVTAWISGLCGLAGIIAAVVAIL